MSLTTACRSLTAAASHDLPSVMRRAAARRATSTSRPFLHAPCPALARGKKTKVTVKLADLPQGALPLDDTPGHTGSVVQGNGGDSAADSGSGDPAYPTVVLQARQNMQKFDNCVLLTRVGGFYELYFEQAEELGPLLNLKVAKKKTNAGPVSMAGFPFFQLDRFLKILIQDLNRYVAVAEEFPNNASDKIKSGGLLHDRRVARIITPGTLIDEAFIDPYANNYVMSIHVDTQATFKLDNSYSEPHGQQGQEPAVIPPLPDTLSLGLAWLDLSTGHFFTQVTDLAALPSILSRICPREVVLDSHLQSRQEHAVFSILAEDRHLITYAPPGHTLPLADWTPMLESEILPDTRDSFTDDEIAAGSLLLRYVRDRLQGLSLRLQPPVRHENRHIMTIDKNSLRSLEIRETIRDGFFRGSLLHAIRRTVTKSGARLLSEWLCSPSTSLEVIQARQDLVARFIEDEDLRDYIIVLLRRSHDSQRLVQKFALGRGDPDDLLALASTIQATSDIVQLLTRAASTSKSDSDHDCLSSMVRRIYLDEPVRLAHRIRDAIDEEGIVHQHEIEASEAGQIMALAQEVVSSEGSQEDAASLPKAITNTPSPGDGSTATKKKRRPAISIRDHYGEDNETWIMKPTASKALRRLHSELASLAEEKTTLADSLRESFNAPSLTLRWTPGLGHICHIKGKDARALPDIKPISSSRSTRSFHHPEWTRLGQKLDQARIRIRAEEQRVFSDLREHVIHNLVKLRRNAAVLDELDVAASFAILANEQALVRPAVTNSHAHVIIGGKHPTVEGGLREQGRSFTRNDCLVGSPGHGRLWLITGPNMAGKSTFLRQNALITILAQVGCYVPADYAEMGIVDAIYSRVGSADNLYRDQSTFMVEMLETAHILRHATPRSFVVMDEIGRGTTPEDGKAVAFAALHHLVTVNRSRTLFATHFHGVVDLASGAGLLGPVDGRVTSGENGLEAEHMPVETYCTDIDEDEHGGFVYVHKLRRGVNRQSHALKVAKLAGLPASAIEMAKQVLGGDIGAFGSQSHNKTETASTVASV